MYVYIDKAITKKNVKVNIGLDSLKVTINGENLIDGNFFNKINSDDSIWTI